MGMVTARIIIRPEADLFVRTNSENCVSLVLFADVQLAPLFGTFGDIVVWLSGAWGNTETSRQALLLQG